MVMGVVGAVIVVGWRCHGGQETTTRLEIVVFRKMCFRKSQVFVAQSRWLQQSGMVHYAIHCCLLKSIKALLIDATGHKILYSLVITKQSAWIDIDW